MPLKTHPDATRECQIPADGSASPQTERKTERNSERTETRTVTQPDSPLARLPLKRLTKRYSFEFYEDQIKKVKQLKIQAEMSGMQVSLSDMVRSALDDYLRDK